MKNTAIDINESTIKKYVESLRPKDKEIRKQLDFGYSYDGKVAILHEIRPFWNNPKEIQNIEFAKILWELKSCINIKTCKSKIYRFHLMYLYFLKKLASTCI